MKRRESRIDKLRQNGAAAEQRAELWANRATAAHQQGRSSDARRCEDKARDWSSRARQLERQRVEAFSW